MSRSSLDDTREHFTARLKRQVLRWLIQKHAPLHHDTLDVLRVMLSDDDWEVRMTAMFATGRLNAAPLRSLVEKVSVPYGTGEGLDTRDRNVLVAAREVIVAHLNGLLTSDQFESTLERMPGIPRDFARAVLGLPFERATRDTLLVHALTHPADTQVPPPPTLPDGLVADEGRYLLRDTGIEFVWVAPVHHWLGDDHETLPTPNPIRLVTPEHGFFIAQHPLSALSVATPDNTGGDPQVTTTIPSGKSSTLKPPFRAGSRAKPEYLTATFTAAQQVCGGLSTFTNANLQLPTADQWEMAARGPDGRRYPTGNGLERMMIFESSPWGIFHAVGVIPQWTSSLDDEGRPLTCGDTSILRCAARNAHDPAERAAIRPVLF